MIDNQVVTQLSQLKNTLLKRKEGNLITGTMFTDDWFLTYLSRKQFFRFCPCTVLFRYNPHARKSRFKVELNVDCLKSLFSIFYLCFELGIFYFDSENKFGVEYASLYRSDKPFLEKGLSKTRLRCRWSRFHYKSKFEKYVQKHQKDRT